MTAAVRVSRRRFLASALAAGSGLFVSRYVVAEQPAADPARVALVSDIHISTERTKVAREVNLVEHFERVRAEILALRPRPAAAIVCGDCAFNDGLPGDYALLRELTAPLRQVGLALHLMMGNHDRREPLWQEFPECKPRNAGLPPEKHVTVLDTPLATWYLLDSMDGPKAVEGRLGDVQLEWLAKSLDAQPNKPALLMAHHYPEKYGKHGLVDGDAFFKVVLPRKQVKAFLFGHSHRWLVDKQDDLHLVNLPTGAYVFDKAQPSGWVDAQLRADGMTLRLNALDKQHPAHGKTVDLPWRK